MQATLARCFAEGFGAALVENPADGQGRLNNAPEWDGLGVEVDNQVIGPVNRINLRIPRVQFDTSIVQGLTRQDLENALKYAEEHRQEIHRDIAENQGIDSRSLIGV
jgi:hypothetical protein